MSAVTDHPIREMMKTEVITVAPGDDLQSVAGVLMNNGIHGVPVVDDESRVIGIVTETDFFLKGRVVLHIPSFIDIMKKTVVSRGINDADRGVIEQIVSARVKDIMTAECRTATPETTFSELLSILGETHYKTIPVVDSDRRIVGIVTATDALSIVARECLCKT